MWYSSNCWFTFARIMPDMLVQKKSPGAVANWLLIGVGMLIIQILLGGITRLTGSGLSITEWNIITGTLPPLNQQQWLLEFGKYQSTPQFQLLNADFTLEDFKFIFFWEWFHRFWARLLGVVFLIPFIYFLVRGYFKKEMVKPLIILFLLGALQGAVGWIMVASGLTGDAVYVKPTRLALHFIFAMGLLCYTYWFALQLLVPAHQKVLNPALKNFTWVLISLLVIQFIYGALMAGHKAATAAYTWPDINGSYFPEFMFGAPAGLMNLIENKITIHFIHRNLAYILFILVIIWTVNAYKFSGSKLFNSQKKWPLIWVFVQVLLGIFAVITSLQIVPNQWGTFEWMAQLHQLVAMIFLLSLVNMIFLLKKAG
jgi:cytochrome c oxidase assembly protein subunit 15